MKINELLDQLKENFPKIRSFGIEHLTVFGSYTKGNENPNSDIDILTEFEEGKKF